MKALYFDGTLQYISDYPTPIPKKNECLVRVELAAICNTDREVLRNYKPGFNGVLGHEFCGIVDQADEKSLIGKRVVCELNLGCGECIYCKTNREKHCVSRLVLGLSDMDGCFAEYVKLDRALLHVVPDNIPPESAVYAEPLAAAMQVLESTHILPSTPVAVISDGRLAYMIAQVLSLNGTHVTVFGKHEEKLAAFKTFADTATAPAGSFETVVEATGSPSGLQTAISLTRSGGTIILKSTYASNASINISELVVREITLKGSRCGPFAPALALIEKGRIIFKEIELYPLNEYGAAFASKAFKAGFDLRK